MDSRRGAHKLGWLTAAMAVLAAAALILARNVELGPGSPVPLDLATALEERPVYAPAEAADHVGEPAVVCGRVVDATFAERTGGQPTYLNFDRPYPDQVFTVVIWGRHRPKFGRPEDYYLGQDVCVSGRIQEHRDVPRIEITEAIQIDYCEGRC